MSIKHKCIGCNNLRISRNRGYECLEGKSIENHPKYCNCYERSENTKYDLYQLVTSVASMILWDWGLSLHGGNDSCIITIYNEKIFKEKLIQELLKNGGF